MTYLRTVSMRNDYLRTLVQQRPKARQRFPRELKLAGHRQRFAWRCEGVSTQRDNRSVFHRSPYFKQRLPTTGSANSFPVHRDRV